MAKDFQRLWENVTGAKDEAGAVRALAEILAEKDGRAFTLTLERKDAEFCIDILDRVSSDFRIQHSFLPHGLVRASLVTISTPRRNRLSLSR